MIRTIFNMSLISRSLKKASRNALRPFTHAWLSERRIVAGLRRLGVESGGILFVHSSLSGLGFVPGGAEAVIAALLELAGPEGTLVMPAHTWYQMERGCRRFDVRYTTCCVGAIAERFRTWPGAVRSLHPTHSIAALGPRARWLAEGHERCESPCGAGSPYTKVLDENCKIIFIGLDLRYNTAYHTVEAIAQVPYLLYPTFDEFEIVDDTGTSRLIEVRRHRSGSLRDADAFETYLEAQGLVTRGRLGRSPVQILSGRSFRDAMLRKLTEDPLHFLRRGCHTGEAGRPTLAGGPSGLDLKEGVKGDWP